MWRLKASRFTKLFPWLIPLIGLGMICFVTWQAGFLMGRVAETKRVTVPATQAIYAIASSSSRESMMASGLVSESLTNQLMAREAKFGKPTRWEIGEPFHTFFARPTSCPVSVTRGGKVYRETLHFDAPPFGSSLSE